MRGVQPLPGEPPPREDLDVGAVDVRAQERPSLARAVVGFVDADVRAPDDPHPGVAQRRRQPGRLRIVQDHDVAGADERRAARRPAGRVIAS